MSAHNRQLDEDARLDCLPGASSLSFAWRVAYLFAIVAVICGTFALILGFGVHPARSKTLYIVGFVGAAVLAFANGANDIANSMGTSVGAGALTLRQAILLGCACEGTGALALGQFVAKSISNGVIEPADYTAQPLLFELAMFCVLWGSGLTTLLATAFGFPISATHGIVGGLAAVGVAAKGSASVGWAHLGKMAIGWVASPFVGMATSFLLAVLIATLVHKAEDPANRAQRLQPFFLWLTVGTCLLFFFVKGPEFMRVEPAWLGVIVAYSVGLAIALISVGARMARNRWAPEIEEVEKPEQPNANRDWNQDEEPAEAAAMLADDVVPSQRAEERPFVPLLIVSAMAVSIAHGGNDVGNSIGPLSAIYDVYRIDDVEEQPDVPIWALGVGAIGFIVGIALMGRNTIATVGNKVTALTPSRSFSTQIGAAVAVLLSSMLELPVSTSHCLIGAVIGVSLAQKVTVGGGEMDLGVLGRIVIGWVVTIPLAMAVALVIFMPLKGTFDDARIVDIVAPLDS